jgi:hypothetical protein
MSNVRQASLDEALAIASKLAPTDEETTVTVLQR